VTGPPVKRFCGVWATAVAAQTSAAAASAAGRKER
jgi:hypothetical protein